MMATHDNGSASSSSASLDALAHLTGIGAQDAKAVAEQMQAFLAQQQQQQQKPQQQKQTDQQQVVDPLPGFVVKTAAISSSSSNESESAGVGAGAGADKTSDNHAQRSTKLFINVCHSPHVPPPPPVAEEEYEKALSGDETSQYRVPMGLSECKNDKDRAGEDCMVFDALVNSDVFSRMQSDPVYQAFCIEIAMELIELRQANMRIRRDYVLPKLTVKGKLSKQTVQRQKRPMIADMSGQKNKQPPPSSQAASEKQLKPKAVGISEITSGSTTASSSSAAAELVKKATSVLQPNFTIVSEPENSPEFFIVTVELPQVRSTKNAELNLELPDKLSLIAPVSETTVYKLQMQLPGPVSECDGAQFDRKTHSLSIVLTAGSIWKDK